MDLNDEKLEAVLDKVGTVVDSNVIIDNWAAGTTTEITAEDITAVIEAVKAGPSNILRNKDIRLTITELGQLFATPQRAYQFFYMLTTLKNKFGTPIYSPGQFGNFTSLHYQGLIENAVIPVTEDAPMPDAPNTPVETKLPEVMSEKKLQDQLPEKKAKVQEEGDAVTSTFTESDPVTVPGADGIQLVVDAGTQVVEAAKEVVKPAKEEPVKPADKKVETKTETKRTPRKR